MPAPTPTSSAHEDRDRQVPGERRAARRRCRPARSTCRTSVAGTAHRSAGPGRDAERQADEDHREQHVEGGVTAAERARRRTGRCRSPCRRPANAARMPSTRPADQRGLADVRPAVDELAQHARLVGAPALTAPAADLLDAEEDHEGGGQPGEREEVERERGRIEVSARRCAGTAEDSPSVRPASSRAAATGVMPYVVARVSWLAVSSRPLGSRLGTDGVLGRQPGHRDRLDQEGGDRGPADDQRAAVVDEQRDHRDRGEQHEPRAGRRRPSCTGGRTGRRTRRRSGRASAPAAAGRRSRHRTRRPWRSGSLTWRRRRSTWRAGRASRRARRRRARARAAGTAGCAGSSGVRRSRRGQRRAAAAPLGVGHRPGRAVGRPRCHGSVWRWLHLRVDPAAGNGPLRAESPGPGGGEYSTADGAAAVQPAQGRGHPGMGQPLVPHCSPTSDHASPGPDPERTRTSAPNGTSRRRTARIARRKVGTWPIVRSVAESMLWTPLRDAPQVCCASQQTLGNAKTFRISRRSGYRARVHAEHNQDLMAQTGDQRIGTPAA